MADAGGVADQEAGEEGRNPSGRPVDAIHALNIYTHTRDDICMIVYG